MGSEQTGVRTSRAPSPHCYGNTTHSYIGGYRKLISKLIYSSWGKEPPHLLALVERFQGVGVVAGGWDQADAGMLMQVQ